MMTNLQRFGHMLTKLKRSLITLLWIVPLNRGNPNGCSLNVTLVDLFNLCKTCEMCPDQWFQYRGITVTSNVYKVFTSVMEGQFMKYLEREGILGELLGAYRKHRRLEDQVFALKGLCNIRKANKQKTWLSFLDIQRHLIRLIGNDSS